MANFAAIFAMGYPVALLANAEERLTLGFISTTINSSVTGSKANCTLQPPAKLPRFRIMRMAVFRMF